MRSFLSVTVLLAVALLVSGRPSSEEGKRLIQTSETEPAKWMTQEEIQVLLIKNTNFFDITDNQDFASKVHNKIDFELPTELRFGSTVENAAALIDKARMESFLITYSAFHNRYYTSSTGVQASDWLREQAEAILASSGYTGQVSITPYSHTWAQNSLIARIEGADPTLASEIIVIGAHLDSINGGSSTAQAPGADDDGSGTTCVMEAFRTLLESGFIPKRTIEFQWYAAEEVGLRGSQAIAVKYANDGVDVVAMANFDMVGYLSNQQHIALITDFTDAGLNAFYRIVISGYSTYPWENQICGYACSDHASWNRQGFRSTHAGEDSINPNLHTIRDTLAYINFNHVAEFVKIAIGFVVELAEPLN